MMPTACHLAKISRWIQPSYAPLMYSEAGSSELQLLCSWAESLLARIQMEPLLVPYLPPFPFVLSPTLGTMALFAALATLCIYPKPYNAVSGLLNASTVAERWKKYQKPAAL